MFSFLPEVCAKIHAEMVGVYWLLIVPVLAVTIIVELFNNKPNVGSIFKRVLISVLLLYSFVEVMNVIAFLTDGITERIGGLATLKDTISYLIDGLDKSGGSWFHLLDTIIWIIAVVSYIIAYVGYFVALILTHFVWAVLYCVSPLMILCYVSESTSNITQSLYKGLLNVATWQVLWSVLGAFLLQIAMNANVEGYEDYMMVIGINLCIGLSMLFIPVFTKSLIKDGLSRAAGALAGLTAFPVAKATYGLAATKAAQGTGALGRRAWEGSKFAAKPITNTVSSRMSPMVDSFKNKVDHAAQKYEQFGKRSQPRRPMPKNVIPVDFKKGKGKRK